MKTVEEILTKIESLDNLEKYQEIIDMIEELPVEQLNSQIISEQGRAYNNIGEYNKAIEILKTIETEEKDTRRWNYRIGFSYYYLDDYENELGRVANGKNKARVSHTSADWFNIRGEKEDRRGNIKTDLNIGVDNQRIGLTGNIGYDTKGHNIRGGVGLRVIF